MTKLFAGLFVVALAVGLGSAPTLTCAQEDTKQEAGKGSGSSEDSTKDESLMEQLEDALKETTTPTDEETDPIGTAEDADRDLY